MHATEQTLKERLYRVRYRPRDGKQHAWSIWPHDLKLVVAQDIADRLWDQGNETTVAVFGSEYDNVT